MLNAQQRLPAHADVGQFYFSNALTIQPRKAAHVDTRRPCFNQEQADTIMVVLHPAGSGRNDQPVGRVTV
ncbi:hypothetical protein D3C79_976010 [compost metagenome]